MRGNHFSFAVGLVTGAVLFGGGTALAAGLLAEPSTQIFYVNAEQVKLEAYAINGHNYVQLRDVGRAVGFNVAYDPARNAAIMEPGKPYTGEDMGAVPSPQPTPAADHSAQANPAVFTGTLTREVYNAIRDTVVNREAILAGDREPVSIDNVDGRRETMNTVTAALGGYPVYESVIPAYGKLACNVKYPAAYAEAVAHTQPFIDSISGMSQREQAEAIAWYVCDRMTYSTTIALPSKILASDEVTAGNCMSYARSFQILCDRAGLPCIFVHSETHQWNKVYVDGQWWDVDVTSNDVGDDTQHREYATILNAPSEMQGADFINAAPEITAFAMELVVPGSTK